MPSATRAGSYGPVTLRSLQTSSSSVRFGLPTPLTPFVGRRQEVASALDLLERDQVRLLTMTGPGGVGKTRLAIEVGSQAAPDFPDGVVFIELASIVAPDRLLPAIARAFEIPDASDQPPQASLGRLLRERRLLLVLDNLEQIVESAPALTELLAECSHLKMLVTSRVTLNVQGEHEFRVPPLSMPDYGPGRTWTALSPEDLAGYDAATLFLQRARAVQPDFSLSNDNGLAIVNICRQLDGLPLAIELAAARLKILTPEALLTRLANRLDILTGGTRDQPQRLQAMRAAIAWSYELLDPAEQALFQQLAVFVGGFTLDAAETVSRAGDGLAIDVLAGVAALVDSSLLSRVEVPSGELRFVMLETIREYALEQLAVSDREPAAHRHHADWCLGLATQAEQRAFGPDDVDALNRLEVEYDNIRHALSWSLDRRQIESGMRLACLAWPFWMFRSYFSEGRAWMERLIERAEPPPTSTYVMTLNLLGILCEALGDFEIALERIERATRLAGELGDISCLALCTAALADVIEGMGDSERSEKLSQDAADLLRETNEEGWLVSTLAHLALLTHRRGDDAAAERFAAEGLAISRKINYSWGTAICLSRQGRIASDAGDFPRAALLFQECLDLWHKIGDRWRITRTLGDLADMAAMMRQPERAARLLGASEVLNEPLAGSLAFADSSGWHRARLEAMAQLDPNTFQRAWDEGRDMSWDEAFAEAMQPLAAGNRPAAASSPPGTAADYRISPRELDVLRLLVDGRTDREIAAALFISPRTAQGHVASIFNKLGVNSRTAAVALAIQNNLISLDGAAT